MSLSAEENADFCGEARALVAELGLSDLAQIHHAPLVRKTSAGETPTPTTCPAGFSPSSRSSRRFWSSSTGPAWREEDSPAGLCCTPCCLPNGFRFYLDDALSDSALEYARLWDGAAGVHVAGVALVGHGVLVGEYRP